MDHGRRIKMGMLAGTKKGNKLIGFDGTLYSKAKLVWLYHYGKLPEHKLGYRDGNTWNTTIENLYETDKPAGTRGRQKIRYNNASGVTGVHWWASRSLWKVEITIDGRTHLLGTFEDKTEAVLHRLAAEQCLGWSDAGPAYNYWLAEKILT
jgi:hypothetical protein